MSEKNYTSPERNYTSSEKNYTCEPGANWEYNSKNDDWECYYSNKWLCEDNDYACLYINVVDGKIMLYCFSGAEVSPITIDSCDFWYFNDKINWFGELEQKSMMFAIADYLCGLFC